MFGVSIGHLTLLRVREEDEVWICDPEDFTSGCSLFTSPPSSRWPFMCFEFGKGVDVMLMEAILQERWSTRL